ncbi:MAG: hypothetical protein WCR30_01365 [Clostridia bacterium]
MQKKILNTILISGNKIDVSVALKENDTIFAFLAKETTPHDGIYNGEFLNETNFSLSLSSCLSKAEAESKIQITEAYVGIPAEFCDFEVVSQEIIFPAKKTITAEVINEILGNASSGEEKTNQTLLSCSIISSLLDDKEKTISPIGLKAKKINLNISFAYVNNTFLNFLNKCFKSYGLNSAIFVPMPVCELTSLLGEEIRKKGALIIDGNTLSVNVFFGKGEGIVKSFSFPIGVAHMVSDIQEVFDLTYSEGEKLVYSTVLSAIPDEKDEILVCNKSIQAKMIWDIVNWRVNQIIKQINSTIEMFEEDGLVCDKIYLTGDGFAKIKGVKYNFERKSNKGFEILFPKNPVFNKPQLAPDFSLLKYSSKEQFK